MSQIAPDMREALRERLKERLRERLAAKQLPEGENPLSETIPSRVAFNAPQQPGMAEAVAAAEPSRRGVQPTASLAGEAATGGLPERLALMARAGQMTATPADRSLPGELGTQLVGGGMDTIQSRAGLLGAVGGALEGAIGENPVSSGIEFVRKSVVEGLEIAKVRVQPSKGDLYGGRSIVGNVARAAPQFAEQVAMGSLPGGTLARVGTFTLAGAGPVIGQVYNDAVQSGQTPGEASVEALTAGYATAITSTFPGFAIFADTPTGKAALAYAIRRQAGAVGSTAVAEGSQEMVESVLHEAIKGAMRHDPETFTPEFWQGLGMEGLVGAILGGGAKVVVAPFEGEAATPNVADATPNVAEPLEAADAENAAAAEVPRGSIEPLPGTVGAPETEEARTTARISGEEARVSESTRTHERTNADTPASAPDGSPVSRLEIEAMASLALNNNPQTRDLPGQNRREAAARIAERLAGREGITADIVRSAVVDEMLRSESSADITKITKITDETAPSGGAKIVGRVERKTRGKVVDLGQGEKAYTVWWDAKQEADARNARRIAGDPVYRVEGGKGGIGLYRVVPDNRLAIQRFTQGASGQEGTPADYTLEGSLTPDIITPKAGGQGVTIGKTGPAFRRKPAELTVSAAKKRIVEQGPPIEIEGVLSDMKLPPTPVRSEVDSDGAWERKVDDWRAAMYVQASTRMPADDFGTPMEPPKKIVDAIDRMADLALAGESEALARFREEATFRGPSLFPDTKPPEFKVRKPEPKAPPAAADSSAPEPAPAVKSAEPGWVKGENAWMRVNASPVYPDGVMSVQVTDVGTQFGKPVIKLRGGTKWIAADDPRLMRVHPSDQRPAEDVAADKAERDLQDRIAPLWRETYNRIMAKDAPTASINDATAMKVAGHIATAIQTGVWTSMLEPRNPVSRKVFEQITGITLPKTIRDSKALFTGKPFPVLPEAPTPAPKPATAPKPTTADKPAAKGWKLIGKNAHGQDIYEDAKGIRSYVEDGIRITEPVSMGPRGEFVGPGTGRTSSRFAVVTRTLPDPASGATITPETANVQDASDQSGRSEPGGREGVSGGTVGDPEQPAAPRTPVEDAGREPDQADAPGRGDAVPGGGRTPRRGGRSGRSGRGSRDRGGIEQPAAEPAADPGGEPVRPGARQEGEGVAPLPRERPKDLSARNHRISQADVIAPSGEKGKVRANIAAIRLLKKLEAENRNALPEEKEVLARYTAWGGVASALDSIKGERWREWLEREAQAKAQGREVPHWFKPDAETEKWADKWYDEYAEIRETMSREEFRDSQETTQYAHYTSRDVISTAIWPIVERLGFKGGAVLESSAGIGHMIGLQPEKLADKSFWVAVEKDSIPARILSKLYPEATVLPQPFEDAKLKAASFDLVVGNVPFARSGPKDKRYPKFSLHNYFLARSIDLLRPNGLMVVITSRSTLDEPASAEFREWAAGRADLLGAIRLPQTAFMANANTKVTTDILIFRKRSGTALTGGKEWVSLREVEVPNTTTDGTAKTPLNEYYAANRDMMLGELVVGRGLYNDQEPMLRARPDQNLIKDLDAAIERLPKDVAGEGLTEAIQIEATGEGSFKIDDKGEPYQVVEGRREYFKPSQAKIIKAYVPMADAVLDVYRLQVDPEASDRKIEAARTKMRDLYRAFQKAHGRINEHFALLSGDPDFYRVAALEVRNRTVQKTERNTKRGKQTIFKYTYTYADSDVLTKRTQFPSLAPTKADSLEDAIAISEAWKGGFDTAYMAQLLQRPEEEVRKDLVGNNQAFLDPASGMLVSRDEYLSGNIKKKIEIARAAGDPAFDANVKALEEVLPKRVSIPSVSFGLGAQWIPPSVYTRFAEHLLGPRHGLTVSYNEQTQELAAAASQRGTTQDREMGGGGMSATELLASKINLVPIRITKEVPSATTKSGFTTVTDTDTDATAAAMFKADQLERQFIAWAKSSEVAIEIEDRYNELFNSSVNRKWTAPKEGRFPGAAAGVTLRPHQARAVVRGLRESYLNANEVGTGKTFIIVTTAMEQRRLGLARKPMVVVQNSTLPQVADAFARLYPSARVLVPTKKDFESKNRKRLLNLIASNDWDAVILPQSQFNLLPNRVEREKSYVLDQIDELEQAIRDEGADPDNAGRSQDPKVKAMARRLSALRKFYDKLMARKIDTAAMPFEDLGVDSLLVDEAHAYKKLAFITRLDQVKGVDTGFSQRGLTLFMKTRWVHERRGGKNVILFTGTPITNTLAEAWTMMRYVRPDLLAENAVSNFDQFVTTYGERSTEYELVAGVKLKQVERIRRFSNIPEFQRLWLQAVDEVRANDVGIPRPPIKGGGRSVVVLKPSAELLAYMQRLLKRYEWFEGLVGKERFANRHVPGVINSLARAAAIDLRLVLPGAADDPGSKLNAIVEDVYQRWLEHKENKLTQAVIIDRFQRGDRGDAGYFNCFDDIRDKLIARGVPADEIASVNDARYDNAEKRGPLFEAVNQGTVRIIMGSTERLGVGVNIQERLVALYHGDVPARPADMEQREGRINRQGNRVYADFGVEPEIIAYGVEKSFDSGGFERLARKQQMQDDARSGKFMGRSIEDDADDVFSYAEAAATLTGDPDFKRRAELETRVRELATLEEEYQRFSIDARRKIQAAEKAIPENEAKIADLESEVRAASDAASTSPELVIQGRTYSGEDAVKEALKEYVEKLDDAASSQADKFRTYFNGPRLTLNGIEFQVVVGAKIGSATDFDIKSDRAWRWFQGAVTTAGGIYDRMLATLGSWRDNADARRRDIELAKKDIQDGRAFLAKPFEYAAELEKARNDLAEVTARLVAKANAANKDRDPNDPHAGEVPDLDITMDDGGASSAPTTDTPQRWDQRLEDRLTAFIEGRRADLRRSRLPRGRNVGGTTLARDIANAALIAAAKAIRATVRGGRKLSQIVEGVLADYPALKPYQARVRKATAAIIKDSGGTMDGLEKVAQTIHADFEAIREKKRARLRRRKAVDERTGVRKPNDPAFKAQKREYSKAVRIAAAGYREGYKHGIERTQAKLGAIIATLRNKQRTMEQRRETVIRMVEDFLPLPVRGKFLRTIENAKRPSEVMFAVRRVLVVMSQTRGKDLHSRIGRWASHVAKLTQERRDEVRRLAAAAKVHREGLKNPKQTTVTLAAHVMELERIYMRIREIYAEHRAENKMIGLDKLMRRDAWVEEIVRNVSATRDAMPAEVTGRGIRTEDPASSWRDRLLRSTSTVQTTAAALEGTPTGALTTLLYDMPVTQTGRKDRQSHDDHERLDMVARRAGLQGLNDAMVKLGGSLGEAMADRMSVVIGGRYMDISASEAMGIAAMDSMTLDELTDDDPAYDKPVRGVLVNLESAKSDTPLALTKQEAETIAKQFNERYPFLIAGIKGLMQERVPAAWHALRRIRGYEPERVGPDYWPRARNMAQNPRAGLAEGWRGVFNQYLENLGLTETRESSKTPFLIKPGLRVALEHLDNLAKITHLAEITRDADMVVSDPRVRKAIVQRFGKQVYGYLGEHIAANSQANETRDSRGLMARSWRLITSNRAVANLALNFVSMGKQIGGIFRLMPMMGYEAWIAGVRGSMSVDPAMIAEHSGYQWKRYLGGGFGRFAPLFHDASITDDADIARAMVALGRNLKEFRLNKRDAGRSLSGVAKSWGAVGQSAMKVYNWWDALPARVAWAGYESIARKRGYTEEATRRFVVAKVEKAVRATQNPADTLDMPIASIRARDSVIHAAFQFTADRLRAGDRIRHAYSRSKAEGHAAALAEAANILWASAIGWGFKTILETAGAALFGDDDEYEKALKRAAAWDRVLVSLAGDAIGLIDPIVTPRLLERAAGLNSYGSGVVEIGSLDSVNETLGSVGDMGNAIRAAADGNPRTASLDKLQRTLDRAAMAISELIGNPLHDPIRRVRQFIPGR